VWLMQGWLFQDTSFWQPPQVKALLEGVPRDRLIILDLFSDVRSIYDMTDNYFGYPFIWCMLHNFGGNYGLYGRADIISTVPFQALATSKGGMVGVGLTMEGTEQNYVMYEMMAETKWRSEPFNHTLWFDEFSVRRYGVADDHTQTAWRAVSTTVYECTTGQWSVTKSMAERRPALKMLTTGFMPTTLHYAPDALHNAFRSLLALRHKLANVDTYRYDVVDWSRQILSNQIIPAQQLLADSFASGNTTNFEFAASRILQIIHAMDRILGTHRMFTLERWLSSARKWASQNVSADFYEFNARNQITLWGPNGEISDYASKGWSGLYATYYAKRWVIFIETLRKDIRDKKPFDSTAYAEAELQFEKGWQTCDLMELQNVAMESTFEVLDEIAHLMAL